MNENFEYSQSSEETLYLILTDIVNSCEKDNCGCSIEWRKEVFYTQLINLLALEKSIALKSIGDALFVIIPNNDNCQKILVNLIEAFLSCKNASSYSAEIRAIIHKVRIGKQNKRGNDIAEKIQKIPDSVEKAKHLINSLPDDIFGKQVNKAARILSLPKGGGVLLTNDVVNDLLDEKFAKDSDKETKKKNAQIIGKIEIVTSTNIHYYVHTPVPITYLKGFDTLKESDDDFISYNKPYIVWHLSKNQDESEATFATEYKERHSFRLLMTDLKQEQKISDKISDIQENIWKILKNNESFKFYTDFCWNVFDFYELENINFSRLSTIRKQDDILKSTTHEGQIKNLTIDNNLENESLNISFNDKHNNEEQDFILPIIVMDSYSQKTNSQLNRSLYQINKDDSSQDIIKTVVPQTIDIFENIIYNNATDFVGDHLMLVFFRFFFDTIKDANNTLENIFLLNINEENGINISPILCGRLTGLIDAFSIYKIEKTNNYNNNNEIFQKAMQMYLPFTHKQKNFLGTRKKIKNFYSYSYITAIFLLEKNKNFDINNNINYFKLASKSSESQS